MKYMQRCECIVAEVETAESTPGPQEGCPAKLGSRPFLHALFNACHALGLFWIESTLESHFPCVNFRVGTPAGSTILVDRKLSSLKARPCCQDAITKR